MCIRWEHLGGLFKWKRVMIIQCEATFLFLIFRNTFQLTKSRVELFFSQLLIVVDVVVLKQVKQCAFQRVLEQALLLDDL